MGRSAAGDVRFDWDGSLQLARQLWELADQAAALANTRRQSAQDALSTWKGQFALEFAGRIDTEMIDLGTLEQQLRAGAHAWATCWADAMNEQNRRLFARQVQRVEADRSNWDEFKGFFVGHDDLPSEPHPVAVPSDPYFAPTGGFVRY